MSLSKEQAREIAQGLLELSHELGTYRFQNWATLTPVQRKDIEDFEWDLLNYSSSFTTKAVGLVLEDLQKDLAAIKGATSKAKKAVWKIKTVKEAIGLATAIVTLCGAIGSKNPAAISAAAKDAFKAAKEIADRKTAI